MIRVWFERFRELPFPLMCLHVAAKFAFGVGLGMLIAGYSGGDWIASGWVLIVLSLVIGIPSAWKILRG